MRLVLLLTVLLIGLLLPGRADAFFGPNVIGAWKAALTGKTKLVGSVDGGWPKAAHIAVTLKKGSGLVNAVQAALNGAIASGDYAIARPFNIAYKADSLSATAQDFINWILSAEGQAIVTAQKYVAKEPAEYQAAPVAGKIVIGGSSSVGPLMQKLGNGRAEEVA